MTVKFDIEKLEKILDDFYNISGITVSVWDAEYNQLAYRPKAMPDFCRMIKQTKHGNELCKRSDYEICQRAFLAKKPVTHHCHAGLIDTAAPIIYRDTLLGFMMFGQIIDNDKGSNDDPFDEVLARCAHFKFDREKLRDAFSRLNRSDKTLVESAAGIIEACTNYLWLHEIMRLETGYLASQVDIYLSGNLDKKITVDTLCARFNLSKNKLYSLFSASFNATVSDYLNTKRVTEAKRLLTSTDAPVYEISEKVGIPDYNYFTKVFKKATGLTPRAYRQTFPLLLSGE